MEGPTIAIGKHIGQVVILVIGDDAIIFKLKSSFFYQRSNDLINTSDTESCIVAVW